MYRGIPIKRKCFYNIFSSDMPNIVGKLSRRAYRTNLRKFHILSTVYKSIQYENDPSKFKLIQQLVIVFNYNFLRTTYLRTTYDAPIQNRTNRVFRWNALFIRHNWNGRNVYFGTMVFGQKIMKLTQCASWHVSKQYIFPTYSAKCVISAPSFVRQDHVYVLSTDRVQLYSTVLFSNGKLRHIICTLLQNTVFGIKIIRSERNNFTVFMRNRYCDIMRYIHVQYLHFSFSLNPSTAAISRYAWPVRTWCTYTRLVFGREFRNRVSSNKCVTWFRSDSCT